MSKINKGIAIIAMFLNLHIGAGMTSAKSEHRKNYWFHGKCDLTGMEQFKKHLLCYYCCSGKSLYYSTALHLLSRLAYAFVVRTWAFDDKSHIQCLYKSLACDSKWSFCLRDVGFHSDDTSIGELSSNGSKEVTTLSSMCSNSPYFCNKHWTESEEKAF